jgi:hypothetical protein
VGEYRAGKSTLSKLSPDVASMNRRGNNQTVPALIQLSTPPQESLKDIDAPIPGA